MTLATHILLFIALYTEIFLLLAFLEYKEKPTHALRAYPSVAIIVPCFNEETTVAKTLHSLLALVYPHNKVQIIAVNDGSTDQTLAVLQTFKDEPRITILDQKNAGKFNAMNAALAHTHADIVGCLDADSFVHPQALVRAITHLETRNADAITPAIMVSYPNTVLGCVQQAEYALSVFIRRAFDVTGSIFVTPGPFSLFRRSSVVALGGWRHAHGTEDMDIAMRMQERGMRIINAPDVHVMTSAPRTLRSLLKQRTRWTYGGIMNFWDFRHMIGNRKHGTLGVIILPSVIISIFAALFFTAQFVFISIERLISLYVKIETVGFALHWPNIPELFFFNTSSITIMSVILVALVIALIYIGKSISRIRLHPMALPLYITLYPFIAPWWLGNAAVRALLRVQAPWR